LAPANARTGVLLVAAAFALVFGSGLGAGWLLERFDAETGFQREADRIAEILHLRPGMMVGDIRAGLGRWTVDMARRVGPEGQVYATTGPHAPHLLLETVADSRLDNIAVITRTPGEGPRLPAGCCDAILLRFVYSDLRIERPGLLPSLEQLSREGGLVAIIEAHPGGPAGPGRQTLPRQAVIAEMTQHGFELVQDYESWFANTYCVVFRKRPPRASDGPQE
jgi:hypothetical protein